MDEKQSDDSSQRNQKNKIVIATAHSILESTIQFFCDNKKGNPTATASGLLIALANRYFMLTAAHVIAEDFEKIYIILPDKELQLGGVLRFTIMPESGNREDDKIDFAVMELEGSVVADILTAFKFISLENIEIGHKNTNLPHYLSVGYPATKTKRIWGKDEISAIPFPYQSKLLSNFEFEKFGFSPTSHIAIKYDGKVISVKNKLLHKAPKLNGVSGSGLWHLKDFPSPSTIKNKQLVGLVIQRVNNPGNKAIVATRIDLITEFIRQYYNVDIPKSPTIKVNLK